MHTVAIFGVPRSGTSWLGQLFNSSPNVAYRYQPLFSYAYKDRIDEESSREEIEQFYRDILETTDDFVLQKKNIGGGSTPDFNKEDITHLVFKQVRYLHLVESLLDKTDTKIIGLVRHPCAVLHSWFNAPKEFRPEWDPLEEWKRAPLKNEGKKEHYYGYEQWKKAAFDFLEFRDRFRDRFYLQLYEELNEDPLACVRGLFEFSGLPVMEQTVEFIHKSTHTSSDDPYGVYRDRKNSHEWLGKLDGSIVDAIMNDEAFQIIQSEMGWDPPGGGNGQ